MKKITKTLIVMLTLALCFTIATPVTAEAATVKKPAKVTSVKKSTATATSIKVTYKKASRAKGYQVQYSTKSSMKSAKTVKTKKTSATISKLKANEAYYIRVRAYNTSSKKKTQYGAWSAKIKVKTEVAKPAQVKSVKKSTVKPNSITVTYAKASNAKGYQIQYATNSSMKSAKTVKSTKTSATISGLTANKTYYVRVRAYNTLSNKKTQYGAWSTGIAIKTSNDGSNASTHTHTWSEKVVVDVPEKTETKEVCVGVKDGYGNVYSSWSAYKSALQAYEKAFMLAQMNGTECTVAPVSAQNMNIYETQTVTVPAVTHTETVCLTCGQKKQ